MHERSTSVIARVIAEHGPRSERVEHTLSPPAKDGCLAAAGRIFSPYTRIRLRFHAGLRASCTASLQPPSVPLVAADRSGFGISIHHSDIVAPPAILGLIIFVVNLSEGHSTSPLTLSQRSTERETQSAFLSRELAAARHYSRTPIKCQPYLTATHARSSRKATAVEGLRIHALYVYPRTTPAPTADSPIRPPPTE